MFRPVSNYHCHWLHFSLASFFTSCRTEAVRSISNNHLTWWLQFLATFKAFFIPLFIPTFKLLSFRCHWPLPLLSLFHKWGFELYSLALIPSWLLLPRLIFICQAELARAALGAWKRAPSRICRIYWSSESMNRAGQDDCRKDAVWSLYRVLSDVRMRRILSGSRPRISQRNK